MAPRSAGNVAVRFSVENAEVVRQALGQLGKDGEKALRQFDAAARPANDNFRVFNAAAAEGRAAMAQFAYAAGPAGRILLGLGPAGLIAAGAIGGVVLALKKGIDAAGRFADEMTDLRDKAKLIGVTTDQLQGIADLGSEFALSQEQVNKGLERFAGALEDVRRGQGTFFDLALKIDPALTRQLASTNNLSDALEILAKLSDKAGQSQARLAREAFGQRNSNVLLLVQGIAAAGGVDKVTEAFRKSGDSIDKDVIDKVARLKTEIDDMSGDAARNLQSIFSPALLENQRTFVEQFRDLTRYMREVADEARKGQSQNGETGWFQYLFGGGLTGLPPGLLQEAMRKAREARARKENGAQQIDESGFSGVGLPTADVPLPSSRPAAQAKAAPANPQVELAIYQKTVSALGAAITPAEQLKLKELELAAAAEAAGVSHDIVNRALASFKLAQDQASVSTRQRLGILTEEELLHARLAEVQDWRAKGFIKSDAEMAEAERLVRKEVKETVDALNVRRSATPNLTKLTQDAADLRGELDQQLSGALRGATSDMWEMTKGTQTLAGGLENLMDKFAGAIAQAIFYKTVVGPIAGAVSSAITSLVPGVGGGAIDTSMPSLGGADMAFSAKGNVFHPFANGGAFTNGIFNRPTMFAFRNGGATRLGVMGEASDEAVMPLKRDSGGRLGVEATMPNVSVNVAPQLNFQVIDRVGVKVQPSQPQPNGKGGFDMNVLIDSFDAAMAQRQADGTGKHAKVLRDQGVSRVYR